MNSELDVVIVTHQSADILEGCLESLPKPCNVYVVDNASTDTTTAVAAREGLQMIPLDENVGYGSACNAGAAIGTSPFLLFLNPDVRLANNVVDEFLAAAKANPSAAFNPCFYNNGRRRFRRWSRLLPGKTPWTGAPPLLDCQIPVLHGACIFIRRDHFARVGGFDSNIFLYHEDDDISLRLNRAGIELRVAVGAAVEHAEGRSTAPSVASARIRGEAMGQSLVYVMGKHNLPLNIPAERRRGRLKLLLPHVLFNAARRAKLLGFLAGLGAGQQAYRDGATNTRIEERNSAEAEPWHAAPRQKTADFRKL